MRGFVRCSTMLKGTRRKYFIWSAFAGVLDILSSQKSAKGMSRLVKLAPLQTSLRQ